MPKNPVDYKKRAGEFLAVASQFRLGELATENGNPLVTNLSALAKDNCADALRALHQIDCGALNVARLHVEAITALSRRIADTLKSGKSIFLCGCGAAGRLSLTCETLWRMAHKNDPLENQVCGFMAGGDIALVQSADNFEEHPEYGARQLEELHFSDGDLLIGCTESGETPYVIGAVKRAAEISGAHPYFLYCNNDYMLRKVAQRSADVLDDPRIEKLNLTVGPMVLGGDTRLQAATVLMIAVGNALLWNDSPGKTAESISRFASAWQSLDSSFLKPFIEQEFLCYSKGEYVLYEADPALAMAVLTDTTERSPTFGLHPFENILDEGAPFSPCYMYMPAAPDSRVAWEILLGRAPRALDWKDIDNNAGSTRLIGFDFSSRCPLRRTLFSNAPHRHFKITRHMNSTHFDFVNHSFKLPASGLTLLDEHLVVKMLLNIHSMLVMGKMGRYEGNIMTWVRPGNNKLIDRTVRCVNSLLQQKKISKSYDEIVLACFELMETVPADRSIALAVVGKLSS